MPVQLATAYVAIVPSMKNVGKSIADAFGSESDTQGEEQGKKAGSGFGRGLGATGAIIGAASAITSKAMNVIGSSISGAVSRADQMNNFPKVMQNLGYSSDDAAKSIRKISDSLDGLPTTTSSMTSMVQQLAPLTGNLDEATEISLAFNNAMLAGGASTEEQANALTQYTQMLAAGKVDMQAWRSIQAAMPGQLNQIAESLLGAGKNGNDLYEAMKNGSVSFDDFNSAVKRLNTDGFGQYASFTQQAKDATQGIGTAMENVQNRVQKAWQKVIDAIGVDNISGMINGISSQFGKIGDTVAGVVTFVKDNADVFAPIAVGIAAAVGVIGAFGTAVKIAAAAQLIFNAAMNANPIMLLVTAIAALVAGLVWFFTQTQTGQQLWQSFVGWLTNVWQTVQTAWTTAWTAISTFFQTIWDGIKSFVTNAINGVSNVISNVLNAISAVWNGIWSGISGFFSGIWHGLQNAARSGIDGVVNVVTGIKDRITGFFSGAGRWLIGAGKAIINGLLGGLKSAFQSVMNFVGGIGEWIKEHKGPLPYDRKLLIPAGNAIMQGLSKGLDGGWDAVRDQVAGMTGELASTMFTVPGVAISGTAARKSSAWLDYVADHASYEVNDDPGSVINNNWKVNIQRGDDLDSAATILYRNVMMDRRRL